MKEEKNRVVDVLASHFYPLVNAADTNTFEAVDTIGRCDRAVPANLVLQNFSVQQCGRERHKNQAEDGYRDHLDDL